MQGQRSIFDPFPEAVDLNQRSNSNSMDESDDWNILSPIERRLLNNDLSSELNFNSVNTNNNQNYRSFSSWDVGESSSRASLQDQSSNDNLKFEQNRSFSDTHNSRFEEQQKQLESSSTIHPHDSFLAGSSHTPMNVNLNVEYDDDDDDDDDDGIGILDLYKSGRPEMDHSGSFSGIGSSECGPRSSLGNWGSSCKRKALEGSSIQSLNGANASRSLNISSNLVNPMVNRREPPTARIGVEMMRGLAASESSQTHLGIRNSGPYNNNNNNINNVSARNPTRSPNINSFNNREISLNEFLGPTTRPPISSNSSNQQPLLIHAPNIPRNGPNYPWGSRNGSSSSSSGIPLRNNMHYHNFVPLSETRSLVQDPTNWSLATGGAPPGASSSNSRHDTRSGGLRPYNSVWTPQHGPTPPSQQRSSEFPPWTLFPSGDTESGGGQRGHFAPFPAGSSSTSEDNSNNNISSVVASARQHYQAFSRSALLMEVPGDDWRALAADIEGRQRLVSEIRQVLNAMRRGENLRAEDYMLFDPFINGVAELHDRHRDMRLDVDNMSYEELLALEERIGNVNTGLSEEVILKSMKQRKHISFMAISTQNMEPCCICQEEYDSGDNIGSLDCGHDFHTDCIKQWLSQKNICPICKMTGLAP